MVAVGECISQSLPQALLVQVASLVPHSPWLAPSHQASPTRASSPSAPPVRPLPVPSTSPLLQPPTTASPPPPLSGALARTSPSPTRLRAPSVSAAAALASPPSPAPACSIPTQPAPPCLKSRPLRFLSEATPPPSPPTRTSPVLSLQAATPPPMAHKRRASSATPPRATPRRWQPPHSMEQALAVWSSDGRTPPAALHGSPPLLLSPPSPAPGRSSLVAATLPTSPSAVSPPPPQPWSATSPTSAE